MVPRYLYHLIFLISPNTVNHQLHGYIATSVSKGHIHIIKGHIVEYCYSVFVVVIITITIYSS